MNARNDHPTHGIRALTAGTSSKPAVRWRAQRPCWAAFRQPPLPALHHLRQ